MKDSLEKGKFLEIDCDEIPAPFAVLQGYWVVQNLYLVMIFAWVVQINCYCGDWVTCDTAADKLRFLLLGSQCLRAFNRGFILLFWLFLLGMRGNLLIYRKMSISRLLWGDRWKLHGEIQPTSTCFKWHTSITVYLQRTSDRSNSYERRCNTRNLDDMRFLFEILLIR